MWRLDWYIVPESAGLKSVRGHKLFTTREEAETEKAYMRATRPALKFTGPYAAIAPPVRKPKQKTRRG